MYLLLHHLARTLGVTLSERFLCIWPFSKNILNCVFQCSHYYHYFISPGSTMGIQSASKLTTDLLLSTTADALTWGRYHGGRQPSSDDSFHSPTVIPPSALDKPSIMKRYHHRRTCSHTSPRRSLTMVILHDARFVECRWWNGGWTVKTVVTWQLSASIIPAPDTSISSLTTSMAQW